jgi:hypothetical protein
MNLRFRFTFRGSAPIEIVPAELAEANPLVRRLRAHLHSLPGDERYPVAAADRFRVAEQALAGFIARCIRLHGEEYFTRVSNALEVVYQRRTVIADELDRVMRGELPAFNRIRQSFDDIDFALPDIIDPADAVPPRISPAIVRGGGVAAPRVASLTEFLTRVRRAASGLSSRERTLLDRANEVDADGLRALLTAEDAGTLRPSVAPGPDPPLRTIDRFMASLRGRGLNETERNAVLETVRRLNTAWRDRAGFIPEGDSAHLDAAIEALSRDGLPNLSRLQNAIRRNPALQTLLMTDPDQLRLYWTRYSSRWRPYGFSRYVLFNMYHARGAFGEWSAAFELGRTGMFVFLKGPKPEVTTGGTDLVAIDVNTGEVFVIDNKATGTRGRIISRVTALMRNFPQNLREDVLALRAAAGEQPPPRVASVLRRLESADRGIQAIVELLPADRAARQSMLDRNAVITLRSGERVPVQDAITQVLRENGINRVVTDAGSPGFVERITSALDDAGLTLERMADELPEE